MTKPVFHHVFRDKQFNGVFEFDLYRSIKNMFSNPTVGLWYDPSDISSMFQDSAGTTPVTSPGQLVGLRLDKSGRGNHATQATDADRLTYGIEPKTGTRNLLLATDTLATQSLNVTATAHTLSFTGAGTVTLSGASTAGPLVGTGAGNRVTLTFTPTAASLTLTVSGSVTLAQLEVGSVATAYQKVVTAFEITETGVPTCHYCAYAGANSMVTASVDFTATDKMSVFAGIRNTVDGTTGTAIELGTNSAAVPGSFGFFTSASNIAGQYRFRSIGTSTVTADATGYLAPTLNVISGLGDISGSSAILRVNGVQVAQSTASQGTGNYGNYPLYFGRRAGSSLPFTGRDYGIIVAGKAASSVDISNAEAFLANNTPTVTL